jgi:uncharacterized SAM-binding protein YcdF (DUF218 family)
MKIQIIKRRMVWFPTSLGWFILFLLFALPFLLWLAEGESFFSLTDRQPPEVLAVESWIGREGLQAAAVEFGQRGYHVLVLTGDLDGKPRGPHVPGDGGESEKDLIQAGVPRSSIILAYADDSGESRTFTMGLAAAAALREANIYPAHVNVFTRGTHARRSRLVFAKAFGSKTKVGAVSWLPDWQPKTGLWWRSPVRTWFVIKETVGYFYEVFFNSGR